MGISVGADGGPGAAGIDAFAVHDDDFGGGLDAADAQDALFVDINITPLVDVVLVLLIIFMVTATAVAQAEADGNRQLEVSLPQAASAAASAAPNDVLAILVAADGRLFADDHFCDREALTALLARTRQHAPATQIVIDADGQLSHRTVVEILDQVRAAGFTSVSIGAQAP